MLATQIEVSDGTLHIINVGIEFFEQPDISVALDQSDPLVEGVDYVWSDLSVITFNATANTPGGFVPNGVEVILRRKSKEDDMYNVYDGGAPFSRSTLDENFQQLLFLSQEFSEGLGFDGLRNNLNMNGYKVTNLGTPTDAGDAINLGYLGAQIDKMLRTPENIPALPGAGARQDKLLSFDSSGNPIMVAPVGGSATALAILLASSAGAGNVGTPTGTVQSVLDARLAFDNRIGNVAPVADGAAMIGRGGQVVPSIAGLKALLKTVPSKFAFATGYYAQGDGGGGPYYLDEADTTSTDNGGTIIVATDGGRWKLVFSGSVDILQFGAKRGVFDAPTIALNNAVFLAARNWLNAAVVKTRLTFSAGTYGYSASPNWAIQNATIEGVGDVHLQYSGTANAWIVDGAGQPNGGCYNNRVYGFVIDAPTTAQNGAFVKNCHHGVYKFKVRGAGANFAGIKVESCVVSRFDDLEVSPNADGAWYTNATPQTGLWLTGGVGTQTSYCTFTNPIMEGLAKVGSGAGMLLDGAFGNYIVSGTSEGCTIGIALGTVAQGCRDNKFFGIDLEANTDVDIYDQAAGSEYHSVNSTLKVQVLGTAKRPQFFGGRYLNFEIASGAVGTSLYGVIFNRDDIVAAGTFVNGDASTCTANCTDEKGNARAPFSQFTVTVATGTFTHTNNTGNPQQAILSGGTISAVNITRGGVDNGVGNVTGEYYLAPGDALKITSSVAPNLRILTL